MHENRVGLEVLPSVGTGAGRVRVGAGLGVGAGVAVERTDAGDTHWSGLGWLSLTGLFELRLARSVALTASAQVPTTLLRRDDRITVTLLPTAWLGVAWGL
jgi:hypothetical protein